ncbi:putative outer membrane protein PmpB [Thermoflexales bacterium]|nr:putative outer membrane protein PmpB [Thermoflexales bacterium]
MNNRIITRWTVVLALACTALAIVSLVLSGATSLQARALATDYTVGGSCGATIQACINDPIVQAGDRILIPAGTYTESLTLDKAVSLIGANANTTIIQAISNQRVLTVTGIVISNSVVISKLTFTGGNATNGANGGGILILNSAQPLIQSVIVTGNHADGSGGGIYVAYNSSLVLSDASISNNIASTYSGGGLACMSIIDTLRLTNVEFINNTSESSGGGLDVYGSPVIMSGGRFVNNRSLATSLSEGGGGLRAETLVTLVNTDFISNSAVANGGGAYVTGITTTISGGRFERNKAGNNGGGLEVWDRLFVTNAVFANNSAGMNGGAVHHTNTGVGRLVNSIIARNTAGTKGAGLMLESTGNVALVSLSIADIGLNSSSAIAILNGTVGITDTIITSYTTGIDRTGGAVYQDYNLFFGNTSNVSGTVSGGIHNVFGDPSFVDPTVNDYHILPPSAAINAGVDAGVLTDLDGNPRPAGGGFDIGAYEYLNFSIHIYLPLLVKNH